MTPWLIGLTDISSASWFWKTVFDNDDDSDPSFYLKRTTYDPKIIGYFKGWFCVQYSSSCNDFIIQLVNLLSNIQVCDLPLLSTVVMHRPFDPQAFALLLCRFMRPILIAIVSQYGDLALWKVNGGSTAWKVHDHPQDDELYYVNITFYHEKLYAMRKEFHKIDIFKVDNDDLTLFPMGVIDSSHVINVSLSPLLRQAYLVEDSKGDNMFLVMQYHDPENNVSYIEFEIFKVENDDRLVKVDTLGDEIL